MIPADEKSLRRLPGIGPYIACAIQSLAFGLDVAAIDASVCRVLMRLHALRGRPDRARIRRDVRKVAIQSLPAGDSSRFKITLHAFRCSTSQLLPLDEMHRWVEWEDVSEYPMPSANRRLIEQIQGTVE